ncbi:Selenoprotein P, partial [Galemys pyrenaicus]
SRCCSVYKSTVRVSAELWTAVEDEVNKRTYKYLRIQRCFCGAAELSREKGAGSLAGVVTTPAMWRSLGLALALCLLPCGGTESQGQSSFCKQPPPWSIKDEDPMLNSNGSVTVASRLEDLRVKLEKEGYSNISYVIVNHQGIDSQVKYMHLKNQVSKHIPVYQQEENQTDVWSLLNGNKDDFLIYDRCGRLVQHLGLPFSFLTFPYVEEAIKSAYCEEKCGNCSLMMKSSAKINLWLLWKKQLRLRSHIITAITTIITIILGTTSCVSRIISFQRISNQMGQFLQSRMLRNIITNTSTRVNKERVTQRTEIRQSFYKRSSDERDGLQSPDSVRNTSLLYVADRDFGQRKMSLNPDSDVCLPLPDRQVSSSPRPQKLALTEAEKIRQK